jgi:hypothetical protein
VHQTSHQYQNILEYFLFFSMSAEVRNKTYVFHMRFSIHETASGLTEKPPNPKEKKVASVSQRE